MIPEQSLIERLNYTISQLDEDSFIELVNNCLGTEYTYDDIIWDKE